jgi:hypothetical protein
MWPFDTNLSLIPGNGDLVTGCIDIGAFVLDFRDIGKNEKSMGKSRGDIKLFEIFCR